MIDLYTFFRSGTSHRLRIALALKGLDANHIPVDLRTEEHSKAAFMSIQPQGLVPALRVDEHVLIQHQQSLSGLRKLTPVSLSCLKTYWPDSMSVLSLL